MTDVTIKVPITAKEGEAVMWCLGQIVNFPDRELLSETDPLRILIEEGFSRAEIMKAGEAMFDVAYGDWLSDPMTPLEKSILRVCVENTTWISQYVRDLPGMIGEAKAALRSLARKLEAFGIEVSHIPAG